MIVNCLYSAFLFVPSSDYFYDTVIKNKFSMFKKGELMKTRFMGVVIACVILTATGLGVGGCWGGSGITPPVSVNDIDGSTNVATDSNFRYTFSAPIYSDTVDTTTYFIVPTPVAAAQSVERAALDDTICDVTNALDASVTCSGFITQTLYCDLAPTSNLEYNTGYSDLSHHRYNVYTGHGLRGFHGFVHDGR